MPPHRRPERDSGGAEETLSDSGAWTQGRGRGGRGEDAGYYAGTDTDDRKEFRAGEGCACGPGGRPAGAFPKSQPVRFVGALTGRGVGSRGGISARECHKSRFQH